MSRIRSKNTKPEEIIRKYLFSRGLRYRKNVKSLPGCPDIVLKKYKTAIFVNGCFWHVHEGCPRSVIPKSNIEYWHNKLNTNVDRDKLNYDKLKNLGWNVLIIWECELKKSVKSKSLHSLYNSIISHYSE